MSGPPVFAVDGNPYYEDGSLGNYHEAQEILEAHLIREGWRKDRRVSDLTISMPGHAAYGSFPAGRKFLVLSDSVIYSDRQMNGQLRTLVPQDEHEHLVIDHLNMHKPKTLNQMYLMHHEALWLRNPLVASNVMIVRCFPVMSEDHAAQFRLMADQARKGSVEIEGSGKQVMTLMAREDCAKYMSRLANRLALGSFGIFNVGSRVTFTQLELAKVIWQQVHGPEVPFKYHRASVEPPVLPLWEVPDMVRTRALTGLTFQEKSIRAIVRSCNVAP